MKNLALLLVPLMLIGINSVQAQMTMEDIVPSKPTTWKGEGYQMLENGKKVDFNHMEVVSPQLDGKLLTFQDTGTGKEGGEVGFQAYGIMFRDIETEKVKMHAWTNDGRYTLADVTFNDDGFYWQFDVDGGGTVRYTVKVSESTWSEIGQYSPPNSDQWYHFLEMKLEKTQG